MVPLKGVPLISRNLSEWDAVDDFSIYVVSGYKSEVLEDIGHRCIKNPLYSSSNMVWSLLMALPTIEGLQDHYIYISYGDIVVSRKNINMLVESEAELSVLVDLDWERLWSLRMEDYIEDVESLRISGSIITEIGKPVTVNTDVEGQYIGVLKVERALLIDMLIDYKEWVERSPSSEVSSNRKNLYLTDFIQRYIDDSGVVTAVPINGGWLEVDSVQDLETYEKNWSAESVFADLV